VYSCAISDTDANKEKAVEIAKGLKCPIIKNNGGDEEVAGAVPHEVAKICAAQNPDFKMTSELERPYDSLMVVFN